MIKLTQLNFFTSEDAPPWLPPPAREARGHAFWAQIIALIEIPISVVLSIVSFYYYFKFSAPGYLIVNPNAAAYAASYLWLSVYFIAVIFVSILEITFIKAHVSSLIDTGKFVPAEERAIIWGIVSILFGLIPGIFLIASAFRLRAMNSEMPQSAMQSVRPQSETQPVQKQDAAQPGHAARKEQQPKPQQYSVPAATTTPRHHADMVKCKKCGASYPAFMHACPNCNEPKS